MYIKNNYCVGVDISAKFLLWRDQNFTDMSYFVLLTSSPIHTTHFSHIRSQTLEVVLFFLLIRLQNELQLLDYNYDAIA